LGDQHVEVKAGEEQIASLGAFPVSGERQRGDRRQGTTSWKDEDSRHEQSTPRGDRVVVAASCTPFAEKYEDRFSWRYWRSVQGCSTAAEGEHSLRDLSGPRG